MRRIRYPRGSPILRTGRILHAKSAGLAFPVAGEVTETREATGSAVLYCGHPVTVPRYPEECVGCRIHAFHRLAGSDG